MGKEPGVLVTNSNIKIPISLHPNGVILRLENSSLFQKLSFLSYFLFRSSYSVLLYIPDLYSIWSDLPNL